MIVTLKLAGFAADFRAIASFLETNYLYTVKLPPITRDLIQQFQNTGPFLAKAKELFGQFAADETLKKFFRRVALERPSIDHDDKATWYGVGDTRAGRWAYAGFFMKGGSAGLYADIEYQGNRLAKAEKLSSTAKYGSAEAERLWFGQGASYENGKTWLRFAKEIDSGGTADDYLKWFAIIFSDAAKVLG